MRASRSAGDRCIGARLGIVDYVGPARDRIVDEVVATVLKGYEKVWRVEGVGGGVGVEGE